jgi:hypothetical protein
VVKDRLGQLSLLLMKVAPAGQETIAQEFAQNGNVTVGFWKSIRLRHQYLPDIIGIVDHVKGTAEKINPNKITILICQTIQKTRWIFGKIHRAAKRKRSTRARNSFINHNNS